MTPIADHTVGIAVVEDNDTLRDLLVSYLDQPGRRVHAADCGEALNAVLEQHPLQIVVLDLNLPYEDGLSITQRLRRSHPDIKIIMLTARARPADRTAGYGAGADVYLTKPTNVAELESVVRNLSSRRLNTEAMVEATLNRKSQVLTLPTRQQLVLTATDCTILEQLALAPDVGIEVEHLLTQLRRHSTLHMSRENLVVTISRLRKKIEADGQHGLSIQTVRNYGYRLTTPLALI